MSKESKQCIVEFSDVHMFFMSRFKRPVRALNGLNLKIHKGSIVGLLGPNGCGKTTAVSCLTGLLFPQQGAVRLWGRPVEKLTAESKKFKIGVVLEDTRLPPFLSVHQAIAAASKIRGISAQAQSGELERIIALTGIKSLLNLKINGLSKGQARRVGVAAALVGDPPLLIMDEPASGLDITARLEFNNLIRNLRDDKRTIIITSHLLSDVENTCSHVAIMQSGKINIFDRTQQLITNDDDDIDIYVHKKFREKLNDLNIVFTVSKYPLLVKIDDNDIPVCDLLTTLSQNGIPPRRIEPRSDLIKYFISITEKEEK